MLTGKYRILVALLFLLCTISLVHAQCPSGCECLTDAKAKETFGEGNYVKCSGEVCGYEFVKFKETLKKYCFKETVDNIPPKVAISYSPPDPTNLKRITFTATAIDTRGIDKIEIWVNARLEMNCTAVTSCEYSGGPYSVGTVTYLANAWDTSGNQASTGYLRLEVLAGTIGVIWDLPKVAISNSPSNPTTDNKVTFTATASDANGISKIEILVNGRLEKTCTVSPCEYTGGPYPAGELAYLANAEDTLGNLASTGYLYKRVAEVPEHAPRVDITHSPANPTKEDAVTFTATATDPDGISKIKILVNAELVKTCTASPCVYTGGPYSDRREVTYLANAGDSLENWASTGYQYTTISTVPEKPSIEINYSPTNPTTQDRILFTATASDPDGIERIEIILNNPPPTNICNLQSFCTYLGGPYPAGSMSYAAVAYDTEGNYASTGYTDLNVISITNTPAERVTTTPIPIPKGDCNKDGKVSFDDASMALEMAVGLLEVDLIADMNGDGSVTSFDAAEIMRIVVDRRAREFSVIYQDWKMT